MTFFIVGGVLVIIITYLLTLRPWTPVRTRELMSHIPGHSNITFLPWLNTIVRRLFTKPEDVFEFAMEFYGQRPICSYWVQGSPNVFINSAEYIEILLKSTKHISKGYEYNFLGPWLKDGLLTSTGSKWHETRKMLTPAFHFRILDYSLPVFNKNVQRLIDILMKKCSNKEDINLNKYIPLCTLDIISEAAMGVELDSQLHNNASLEYVSAVKKLGILLLNRLSNIFKHINWIYELTLEGREQKKLLKIVHGFTENVIRESRKKRELAKDNEDSKPSAFVDLLLEMSEKCPETFSDIDIRQEVDTFMFEGHETTSSAVSWSLLLLSTEQEMQEKAYRELQEIFGESNRHATMQDLSQMVYLEAIIKESLRLYPPVSYMTRMTDVELQLDKYRLPAGTTVVIMPYKLHRDSNLYPNPEKFDPDRFLIPNNNKQHSFMYIPFSGGPRNCIGKRFAMMELKVVLSNIIRQFKIGPVTKKEDLTLMASPVLRSFEDIYVKLHPRSQVKDSL